MHGMGWIKDQQDKRDYDLPPSLGKKNSPFPSKFAIPRDDFSSIRDQEDIGSCTAFAACGIMEYFVKKKTKTEIDFSELFLYLETRREIGKENEDWGAYIRTAMKALVSVGVCLEKYWPYDTAKFAENPPAHVYPRADDYVATKYYRIDHENYSKEQQMMRLKAAICAGLPCMTGFSVYKYSMEKTEDTGDFAFPAIHDPQVGGHAVVIYGYDDNYIIKNDDSETNTRGAFLIRNSWGDFWGDGGYGAIPYKYFEYGHMSDIWCMYNANYINVEQFE